jgi:hypothetical protein
MGAGLLLVACGSNVTGNGPAPNGGTGGPTACSPPAGTYVESFTQPASQAGCPDLANVTLVLNGTESFASALDTTDAGDVDGGTVCSTDIDQARCSVSSACTTNQGANAVVTMTTITFSSGQAIGQQSVNSTNPTAMAVCSYAIKLTKS